MFEKKVISKADYEKAQKQYLQQQSAYENAKSNLKQYLQQQSAYENAKSSLSSNEMQINNLESQIIDLDLQNNKEINQHKIQIEEAKNNLKAQIKQWEKQYLLISPITVAVIVPDTKTKVIGRLTISATGIGKVKKDQTVNIKFDNFPYMEFGLVKGKVKNISLVPVTPFSQQMTGTAEIITEDISLLQRFFNPIRSIFKKNFD